LHIPLNISPLNGKRKKTDKTGNMKAIVPIESMKNAFLTCKLSNLISDFSVAENFYRAVFIVLILMSNLVIRAQTENLYKIHGQVLEKRTIKPVKDAVVTLKTNTGKSFETISDTSGVFEFNSISDENTRCVIIISHSSFFAASVLVSFSSTPSDTIIQVHMEAIPYHIDWFPEVYFIHNTTTPLDSSIQSIHTMAMFLNDNPTINMKCIGYKDSLETIDLRQERAAYVYHELIKLGVEKTRLTKKASARPNILKSKTYDKSSTTCEIEIMELDEEYISNSPIEEQSVLRQYNQCVGFDILP